MFTASLSPSSYPRGFFSLLIWPYHETKVPLITLFNNHTDLDCYGACPGLVNAPDCPTLKYTLFVPDQFQEPKAPSVLLCSPLFRTNDFATVIVTLVFCVFPMRSRSLDGCRKPDE